jgi:GT2 family glycosyltransferase
VSEKVYIIILNWNGKEDTIECLNSVLRMNYPNYEVVVVDNGSIDGSVGAIRKTFPQVMIIANQKNLGFAGGNNVGIRYALDQDSDFIFLLNNDTCVDAELLNELVSAYRSVHNPGFLGCKIFFYDKPDIVQHYGGRYAYNDILKGYHYGEGEKDDGRFNDIVESEYVTGCAIIAHRSLLENIGLLDERFFVYWEDGDWCLRARAAGFKNYVAPSAKLWHKVSASNRNSSSVNIFYTTRNRHLFAKKHGFQLRPLYWSYVLVRDVLKTQWNQRFSAVYYILFGHFFALLGIYGKMPKFLEKNIFGSAEQRIHSILRSCKNYLRKF